MNIYYIPCHTTSNFYIYDIINRNLSQCDKLSFLIYSHLYKNNLSTIDVEKTLAIENISAYSKEEIRIAVNNIKMNLDYIEKRKYKLNYCTHSNLVKNDLLNNLADTRQIILEVTRECNLKCTYCCYGDLYKKKKNREIKDEANVLITYIQSVLNLKKKFGKENTELTISFYGGEALLKMGEIEKIVSMISKTYHTKISYNMTTNGVLLDKHIDYLVKYNFILFISLDGNKQNDSYRVYPNGKESFSKVEQNILHIKKEFPFFFENNIFFLTVLHNRNSCLSVNEYFRQYNKSTKFSSLLENEVRKNKLSAFQRMLHQYDYTEEETNSLKLQFPNTYNELFDNIAFYKKKYLGIPTNETIISSFVNMNIIAPGRTCRQFQHRVFVTIDGLLLPCERVDRKYYFGRIINGKININTKKVNSIYQKIDQTYSAKCSNCFNALTCSKCFLQDEDISNCFNSLKQAEAELNYLLAEMEGNL